MKIKKDVGVATVQLVQAKEGGEDEEEIPLITLYSLRKTIAKSNPKGKKCCSTPREIKNNLSAQIDEVSRRKGKFLFDALSVVKKAKVHLELIFVLRKILLEYK